METKTSTQQGVRIGRSATIHMQSKHGGVVCGANRNDPTQRPYLVDAAPTCKTCAKRAASVIRRGFQP